GAANKPLSVNLYFDKGLTGFYSIRPDFHVKTSYDFDTFNIVQEKIKQIIGLGKTDARARLEQSFQAWNAADSRLTWEARACLPETAEELFWEVVEHVQRCINSRKDDSIISCRCNLSRVDFSLLGDEFEVVLEQSDTVVARLQKNGASVLEHTLDGAAKLGYHPPQEEFSVSSLKPSNTLALRWNGANNIYFSGIDAINGISPHLSIFRNKISDHDTFAFIPDPSRTILYEQFSECPLPEESTLRLCVSTGTVPVYNTESGKMVQKPVKFKLAADLRK
ncbi:hypothetical protein HY497_02345, partial [Candidatus Woesearchaeota archaeon]|nr:hypothetical protein [Candidatus Woesearchaeota archaeon]